MPSGPVPQRHLCYSSTMTSDTVVSKIGKMRTGSRSYVRTSLSPRNTLSIALCASLLLHICTYLTHGGDTNTSSNSGGGSSSDDTYNSSCDARQCSHTPCDITRQTTSTHIAATHSNILHKPAATHKHLLLSYITSRLFYIFHTHTHLHLSVQTNVRFKYACVSSWMWVRETHTSMYIFIFSSIQF